MTLLNLPLTMKTIELLSSEKIMNKFSPSHYQRGEIEVWDFIADQNLDYFTGNVIKYLCRAGHKDRETELDDLQKAKVYIEKRIAIYHDRT
jgi:hypothetical protein